jgi:ABC-2 type transport system ATP-binding protein
MKKRDRHENRRFMRIQKTLSIAFHASTSHTDKSPPSGHAVSRDISASGLCIELDAKTEHVLRPLYQTNTRIVIGMDLPECPSFIATADVIWIRKEEKAKDTYIAGLHFTEMKEAAYEALVAFIREQYLTAEWAEQKAPESDFYEVVEAEHLTHWYFAGHPVLRDVHLTIRRGEIFGLLGSNGSGKTTLLKLLNTTLKPSRGRATVLGFDTRTQRHLVRRNIGFMPQKPSFYEDLSVVENLEFFARGRHIRGKELRERVDDVLSFVEMDDRADELVGTLSHGMKQRLSMACAQVHRPRLLFLDEPTAGVDPRLRRSFWKSFRQLKRVGVTVITTTHQMDEAVLCDRLAFLHNGRILICDTPENLFGMTSSRVKITVDGKVNEYDLEDYRRELPCLFRDLYAEGAPEDVFVDIGHGRLDDLFLKLMSDAAQADREANK